jgi:hypothetical protein
MVASFEVTYYINVVYASLMMVIFLFFGCRALHTLVRGGAEVSSSSRGPSSFRRDSDGTTRRSPVVRVWTWLHREWWQDSTPTQLHRIKLGLAVTASILASCCVVSLALPSNEDVCFWTLKAVTGLYVTTKFWVYLFLFVRSRIVNKMARRTVMETVILLITTIGVPLFMAVCWTFASGAIEPDPARPGESWCIFVIGDYLAMIMVVLDACLSGAYLGIFLHVLWKALQNHQRMVQPRITIPLPPTVLIQVQPVQSPSAHVTLILPGQTTPPGDDLITRTTTTTTTTTTTVIVQHVREGSTTLAPKATASVPTPLMRRDSTFYPLMKKHFQLSLAEVLLSTTFMVIVYHKGALQRCGAGNVIYPSGLTEIFCTILILSFMTRKSSSNNNSSNTAPSKPHARESHTGTLQRRQTVWANATTPASPAATASTPIEALV